MKNTIILVLLFGFLTHHCTHSYWHNTAVLLTNAPMALNGLHLLTKDVSKNPAINAGKNILAVIMAGVGTWSSIVSGLDRLCQHGPQNNRRLCFSHPFIIAGTLNSYYLVYKDSTQKSSSNKSVITKTSDGVYRLAAYTCALAGTVSLASAACSAGID